jgi:hypothetical protein
VWILFVLRRERIHSHVGSIVCHLRDEGVGEGGVQCNNNNKKDRNHILTRFCGVIN